MTASSCFSFVVKTISSHRKAAAVVCGWLAVFSCGATTLLDDTFADGTRNNQNLPTDAAWYVSSSGSWTTAVNSMTVANGTTAILGVSYFGVNSSTPVSLGVGDTLVVTVKFTFNNVSTQNTSANFRLGIYDFADSTQSPKWATTDLSGNSVQGGGVQGYSVFQNFGATFSSASPMDIRVRTNLTSTSLLGSSGDHKSLITGPGSTNNFQGFTNGGQYSLQFTLFRTNSTDLLVTVTWHNLSGGATLSTSVLDANATTFNFDGIGFRPQTAVSTATNITFNEVRVDLTGVGAPPPISFSPSDVSAYTGQSAFFSVVSDGSAPLSYQWYFNTNTPLLDATNSSLTLTDLQTTNSGSYSVIVTNLYGADTSDVAQLTVTVPVAPTILTDPQGLTVLLGAGATFNVSANGSTPFSYQWNFNTNTPVVGANNDTLVLNNVQSTNAGAYSVIVNNLAGSATSSVALLMLNTNPIAPSFVTQPASVIALAGGVVSFSGEASGTATIYYQWLKNGSPIAGATATTLNFTNVQNSDSGSYTLVASNSVGTATSSAATLTIASSITIPNTAYNLNGFGNGTTGGGVIPDTDPAYRKVYTPLDLTNAVLSAYKTAGSVKVVEIMNDLDLGWNEVGAAVQTLGSTPFRAHNPAQLHPRMLVTGVSLIDIKPKSGLTIFSANGATIRHACFNFKSTANIIVRNLKFDEMWEWDEASKGNYDKNDWDFIDLGNGGTVTNIWIDHCIFTKSYDGEVDIKQGSSGITFSWCKYTGDDGATNTNSWVWQQISSLESNKTSYAFYNFLRTHGFSPTDIVTIIQGHDKTHLIGANSLKAENALHTITFHHNWFNNPWDRLPRLRAGNVHNYNIYVDDTLGLAAKRLRDARANAMSTADRNTLNNTYSFNPFLNGSISTENGAVLVEKSVYIDCITPLRNNQTDPANPVYTGKIKTLDTIYQFDDTVVRGNSTDPGNPLGPFQAPVIAFSWNLPGNQLPYACHMDDPSQLQAIVTSPTGGAGAGVLTWAKTNWLATSYAPTAPIIVAQPQNLTIATNQNATFTVVAGGSANLNYQWYFNTNTPVPNATNSSLTLLNVQAKNGGFYSVTVTNAAGSTASTNAFLTVSSGADARPQMSGFVFTNGTFSLTITGVSGPDYIVQASTNLIIWDNIFTNHSPAPPFVWSDAAASNFNQRFYRVQLSP